MQRNSRRPLPNKTPRVQSQEDLDRSISIAADLAADLSSAVIRAPRAVPNDKALVRKTPVPAPAPAPVVPATPKQQLERAYVAVSECEIEEVEPLKTSFFDTINKVKALTAHNQKLVVRPGKGSLADARGYSRDDLYAIAEIAYHYLFSGGTKLALALYEGLNAVKPDEPYFALALGLTHDHLGDKKLAFEWYTRARELDPGDARPDINCAELLLESGDFRRARQLLGRACAKAQNRGDAALEKKAASILQHIDRQGN